MTNTWENYKILVVEDVKTSMLFFVSILRRTGATIISAQNGEQAIEIVNNNQDIDVIIMDVVMPKMDGLKATQIIKKINSKIKIILQTAQVLKYTKKTCIDAGGDAYLEKPVSPSILKSTINTLLKNKQFQL